MSIRPLEGPRIYDAVKQAGVMDRGHTVLNSGRHTMIKVHLDRVVDNPTALEVVQTALRDSAKQLGAQAIIPVPKGAEKIAMAGRRWLRYGRPVYSPMKLDSRSFEFPEPEQERIAKLGRVAIFEDVVTTGATPAAVARELLKINPDIEVHLIDGWLRGSIMPAFEEYFTSITHFIERPIEDWLPEDCPYHEAGDFKR
ncbi:MAG TPA: hypothetical protein VG992_00140 [Candidatus Saccharimonadales bacterium]|nr:hypothetical protein [Candidatus Saccharimonadales bacterium]